MYNKRNFRRKYKKGALEGLPLYLIILVVIAFIALGIFFEILQPLQKSNLDYLTATPNSISFHLSGTGSSATCSGSTNLVIIAYGTNGKPLTGVAITLSGYGNPQGGSTGSNGQITFQISCYYVPYTYTYQITVTGQYTGTTPNTAQVIVEVTDTPS